MVVPSTSAVMVVLPAFAPAVTVPSSWIVATEVFFTFHFTVLKGVVPVTFSFRCCPVERTVRFGLIFGSETLTVVGKVAEVPSEYVTVAVISARPACFPVTTPLAGLTLATFGWEEAHTVFVTFRSGSLIFSKRKAFFVFTAMATCCCAMPFSITLMVQVRLLVTFWSFSSEVQRAFKVTVPGFSALILHLFPEVEMSTTFEEGSASLKDTESPLETLLKYTVALSP